MAVDLEAAFLEDDRRELELGWIVTRLRADVADVVGADLNVAESQRLERSRVDVHSLAVADDDFVDLERIDRFEGLLPSLLRDRCRILRLLAEVLKVHVELRVDELEVGHDLPMQERLPLNTRVEALDMEDGRIGMRVLGERQPVERQAEAERVEAQPLDARRVSLQAIVHPALDRPAQRLVDEEGRDDEKSDEAKDDQRGNSRPLAGYRKART